MQAGEVELESEEQGCGCFRSFGVFTSQKHGDRLHLLPESRDEKESYSWLVRQVKKLREVSEIVAGPKWKNFLRKIGAYLNDNKRTDFQYDSFNYTLNFDDGNLNDEDYGVNLGFSSRFAPPVVLHDKPARKST